MSSQDHPNVSGAAMPHPGGAARPRLFCLPYAGRGASLYRSLAGLAAPDLEIRAVQLPGRENRRHEPSLNHLSSLVERLTAEVHPHLGDGPFAFFGHSFGALLAYEVARRLGHAFGRWPTHLFVSACRAPHLPSRGPSLHQLPDAELVLRLAALGGTPREILDSHDLMAEALPRLRADLCAFETYRHAPGRPLPCPIVTLSGRDDALVELDEQDAWRGLTDRGVRSWILPGGHFFLDHGEAEVLRIIRAELLGRADASAGAMPLPAGEVHVWEAGLDRTSAEIESMKAWLTPGERERADALHRERDRHRAVACRAVVREILGRYLRLPPGDVELAATEWGKPWLRTPPGGPSLGFNVSHTEGLALIAVARDRELGIDVERIRPDVPSEHLVGRTLTDEERAEWHSIPPAARAQAFMARWTQKEAYVKATGRGLSTPFEGFRIATTAGRPSRIIDPSTSPEAIDRWSICELPLGPGHVGAIVVEGRGWILRRAPWKTSCEAVTSA